MQNELIVPQNRYFKTFYSHPFICTFLFFQAKPSQAVVAAKRNARMRQGNKKVPDIIIKDIYHTVRFRIVLSIEYHMVHFMLRYLTMGL